MRSPLAAALLLAAAAPPAACQLHSPSQSSTDADYWSRLPGGGSRPFITAISVTTGGATTTLWSGATSASTSPPAGYEAVANRISAVVTPTNMCNATQTPAAGVCYASPNRVAIALGVTSANNGGLDMDFSTTSESPAIDTTSVFDVTLNLGAYADSNYAWSWVNGDAQLWNVSSGGIMRLKVRAVSTPSINWASVGTQCCTCDVPANCNVPQAAGATVGANWFFQTAPSSGPNPLAGAMFATRNAVMGSLTLNSAAGSLDYAMASAHLAADGSAMLGQLSAFLPSAAVASVFPDVAAADVPTRLNVTRAGDAGTTASAAIAAVAAATFGSDGFMVSVTGATFSAPTYRVAVLGGSSGAAPRAYAAYAALAAALVALLL